MECKISTVIQKLQQEIVYRGKEFMDRGLLNVSSEQRKVIFVTNTVYIYISKFPNINTFQSI